MHVRIPKNMQRPNLPQTYQTRAILTRKAPRPTRGAVRAGTQRYINVLRGLQVTPGCRAGTPSWYSTV